jgi:hypothetical protein
MIIYGAMIIYGRQPVHGCSAPPPMAIYGRNPRKNAQRVSHT